MGKKQEQTKVWIIVSLTGYIRQVFKKREDSIKALEKAGYHVGTFTDDWAPFYIKKSDHVSTCSCGEIIGEKLF